MLFQKKKHEKYILLQSLDLSGQQKKNVFVLPFFIGKQDIEPGTQFSQQVAKSVPPPNLGTLPKPILTQYC